ncbi:MAG: hypothetical protein CMM15_10435 [Rhodospirillaceae bacterium]|nr:hypothetical protein [Rhodospirillaceae bacterium]
MSSCSQSSFKNIIHDFFYVIQIKKKIIFFKKNIIGFPSDKYLMRKLKWMKFASLVGGTPFQNRMTIKKRFIPVW